MNTAASHPVAAPRLVACLTAAVLAGSYAGPSQQASEPVEPAAPPRLPDRGTP